MNIEEFEKLVFEKLKEKNSEVKRVFHGRGNFYENFNFLTVDSLNNTLFAVFYDESNQEEQIVEVLKNIAVNEKFDNLIVQRKYRNNDFCEAIIGKVPEDFYVVENGLKYKIDFKNKNIGLFFDMKKGREYIQDFAKNKTVLNLFSYTCAFSVVSIFGGASKVVNIDMAKNSLSLGRLNHQINNLNTKCVKFLPYNILKSFGRVKKEGPFDIVIIDPPSFQKGSFIASSDYEKIIKKLDSFTKEGGIVLACLNDPFLSSSFLVELFEKNAPNFEFIRKLENQKEFIAINEENSLKNMIFQKKVAIIPNLNRE